MAGCALLNPHRAFGEAEPVAEQFRLRAGLDDGVERRVQLDDGERPRRRRLSTAQELRVDGAGGSGREADEC